MFGSNIVVIVCMCVCVVSLYKPINHQRSWDFTFKNVSMSAAELIKKALLKNQDAAPKEEEEGGGNAAGGSLEEVKQDPADAAQDNNNNNNNNYYYYYLGDMPKSMQENGFNRSAIFLSEKDRQRDQHTQYLWLSSGGVVTHTHCDMDHNLFIQIYGNKTFYLRPPHSFSDLRLFPRIHPLWHKSQQLNTDDAATASSDGEQHSYHAHLSPGDLLYVPPYWFHKVVSNTASISATAWSLDYEHYERMDSIYRYEQKFSRFVHPKGRFYGVRLFLDLLLQRLYGIGATIPYLRGLLSSRYSSKEIRDLFPRNTTVFRTCQIERAIPLRHHVIQDSKFDAEVISELFFEISAAARDIMVMNYIEEATAAAIGWQGVYPFFRYCFDGKQEYIYGTEDDDDYWEEPGDDDGDNDV